jgi:hypothetical protein
MGPNSDMIKNADKYGYAVVAVSTPKGAWVFPNNGIINKDNLSPCKNSDSVDVEFMSGVMNWIESDSKVNK